MFKLVQYEAQPVGKREVSIRLKCLLVVIVFGLVIGMIVLAFVFIMCLLIILEARDIQCVLRTAFYFRLCFLPLA